MLEAKDEQIKSLLEKIQQLQVGHTHLQQLSTTVALAATPSTKVQPPTYTGWEKHHQWTNFPVIKAT